MLAPFWRGLPAPRAGDTASCPAWDAFTFAFIELPDLFSGVATPSDRQLAVARKRRMTTNTIVRRPRKATTYLFAFEARTFKGREGGRLLQKLYAPGHISVAAKLPAKRCQEEVIRLECARKVPPKQRLSELSSKDDQNGSSS
jgi:hypothetical protein